MHPLADGDEDGFAVEDEEWAAACAEEARLQRAQHRRAPSSADAEHALARHPSHRRTLTLG